MEKERREKLTEIYNLIEQINRDYSPEQLAKFFWMEILHHNLDYQDFLNKYENAPLEKASVLIEELNTIIYHLSL